MVSLHAVILSNEGTNGWGTFVDEGYNLSSDNSIAFTKSSSRAGIDVRLGPFQIPDGFGGYFAARLGSPALEGGDRNRYPETDLRGVKRPAGSLPDIGAIEGFGLPNLSVLQKETEIVIDLGGALADKIAVESSNDLIHWEVVTVEPGSEQISLALPVQGVSRFYRLAERR